MQSTPPEHSSKSHAQNLPPRRVWELRMKLELKCNMTILANFANITCARTSNLPIQKLLHSRWCSWPSHESRAQAMATRWIHVPPRPLGSCPSGARRARWGYLTSPIYCCLFKSKGGGWVIKQVAAQQSLPVRDNQPNRSVGWGEFNININFIPPPSLCSSVDLTRSFHLLTDFSCHVKLTLLLLVFDLTRSFHNFHYFLLDLLDLSSFKALIYLEAFFIDFDGFSFRGNGVIATGDFSIFFDFLDCQSRRMLILSKFDLFVIISLIIWYAQLVSC